MDIDDIHFVHLLANPYRSIKTKPIKNNREEELITLLKKLYPTYVFHERYQGEIWSKIETILKDYTIQSTIDDLIQSVECNTSENNLKGTPLHKSQTPMTVPVTKLLSKKN